MIKQVCNMCGNEFSQWDKQENFGMNYHVGYGSLFDGDDINLDLCCECFDNMMKDYILSKCKINPVKSFYDEYAKNIEETEGSGALQPDSNKTKAPKKKVNFMQE